MSTSSWRRWFTVATLLVSWAAAHPPPAWSQGEGHAKPPAHTAKPAQAAEAPTKPAADPHAKPAAAAADSAKADEHAAPAKEAPAGKARRAPANNPEVSAREVVRRLETVMTEATRPAKATGHEQAAPAPHGSPARPPVRRGATRPKPAPLLNWPVDLASSNVRLDWGTFGGVSRARGVRLQWSPDEPVASRK